MQITHPFLFPGSFSTRISAVSQIMSDTLGSDGGLFQRASPSVRHSKVPYVTPVQMTCYGICKGAKSHPICVPCRVCSLELGYHRMDISLERFAQSPDDW